MRVVEVSSAVDFDHLCRPFLLVEPAGNTLVLSTLQQAMSSPGSTPWGAVAFGARGTVLSCALRSQAAVFLSVGRTEAAFALGHMLANGRWPQAVVGPQAVARAFARALGRPLSTHFTLRLLKLTAPVRPQAAEPTGHMRAATIGDIDWLRRASAQFRAETGLLEDTAQADDTLTERVKADAVRLWCADAAPLAYLVTRRIGADACRISAVFTTPPARNRGVAHALVGAGCTELRQQGVRDLHLFADATNRSAAALYRRAGFRLQAQYLHLVVDR